MDRQALDRARQRGLVVRHAQRALHNPPYVPRLPTGPVDPIDVECPRCGALPAIACEGRADPHHKPRIDEATRRTEAREQMSRSWAAGSTTRWRQIRAYVLRRDGYTCQINGPVCTRRATEVDHIVEKAHGGQDNPDNLRAACRACNLGRNARQPAPEPPTRKVSNW